MSAEKKHRRRGERADGRIGVARTVMIVDRKDLDSQTKNEFGKFASEYNTGLTSGDVTDNTFIEGIAKFMIF